MTLVLIIIAGVAVWSLKPAPPPEPRPVGRFSYELPGYQQFVDLYERGLAVSPDGTQFVYCANSGLCLRSLDQLDARLITGTEGARTPFFSPDGRWIGYVSSADNKLKKIATSGGAPVTLTSVSNPRGSFSWGADDIIVYAEIGKGIMRVSAKGGTPDVIVKAGNENIFNPQVLPDGKSVLFMRGLPPPVKFMVQNLKSGKRKELLEGDTARYVPTGHIVYAVDNNIFAIPFDVERLEIAGGPVSMVDGVTRFTGAPQYAVSDSGTLVYVPSMAAAVTVAQRTLVWVDRNRKEEPLTAIPHPYASPRISPDGTRVTFSDFADGNRDLWIWDLARKIMTRLTFDIANEVNPLWTPDSKRVAYVMTGEGRYNIYWKAADGTGKVELLSSAPDFVLVPSSWSSDGKTLVVMTAATGGLSLNAGIGALSVEADRKFRSLLKEKYNEVQPMISPDGRWMAYTSNESGQYQIYVHPFPDVDGGRWQISPNGGDSPLWSRDGRELFYRNGDAAMAVSVLTEPSFSFETPKVLFHGTYVSFNTSFRSLELHPWDISHDGKRFLMMKEPESTATAGGGPRKINIVLNWFEELKQRVPVK